MRVFITGDRGHIGAAMTPFLMATGHEAVDPAVSIHYEGRPTLLTDRRHLTAAA